MEKSGRVPLISLNALSAAAVLSRGWGTFLKMPTVD